MLPERTSSFLTELVAFVEPWRAIGMVRPLSRKTFGRKSLPTCPDGTAIQVIVAIDVDALRLAATGSHSGIEA